MSRSQAGIVCSADRSTTQLANVQDAASQPFPRSLPPSSLFSSSLSVLQEVHPLSSPRKGSRGCQVTTSAAHCSAGVHFLLIPCSPWLFPVRQHQPPPSPDPAYDQGCPRLWSWGGDGERCSSRRQRRNSEENWEQILKKKEISLQASYMIADSYAKSINSVIVIRALSEPILIDFCGLWIISGINTKY